MYLEKEQILDMVMINLQDQWKFEIIENSGIYSKIRESLEKCMTDECFEPEEVTDDYDNFLKINSRKMNTILDFEVAPNNYPELHYSCTFSLESDVFIVSQHDDSSDNNLGEIVVYFRF